MLTGRYRDLTRDLARFIPHRRLLDDELGRLAYGTDASFYRLLPQLVVKVESEEEVLRVFGACRRWKTPLTFRAAGTSLSGQAVSDSVLVVLGRSWKKLAVSSGGLEITLGPGVIGGCANQALQSFHRKIGPDPASIHSAMIGGIAATNASGMCCGTAQTSYRTLAALKLILADGSAVDTANAESRRHFEAARPDVVRRLSQLARRVRNHEDLAARIRKKYRLKNTTGYSLNALTDFDDPIEIMQHLMIGSEGTLGFISELTYRTVADPPHKASSLLVFPDLGTACEAVKALASYEVSAVELLDRASLRSVEGREGAPPDLKGLDEETAALLVEVKAEDPEHLDERVREMIDALSTFPAAAPVRFSSDPAECAGLWKVRKGLFTSVGAMRPVGTTVIIEDVAFPVSELGRASRDLQTLFKKHGYHDAILFGHAVSGNLHFVFSPDFNRGEEVARYGRFMQDLARLVIDGYDGSMKAEHGTGRNAAPFVEMEWGRDAYALMKEIKSIFDPENILNPGVILNSDPEIHLKHLKPLPKAHAVVDRCIECGYCEPACPSKDLTLSPRQRIAIFREITRLSETGKDRRRLAKLKKGFAYQGDKTCAADGLCALRCPVGINTGALVKDLRARAHSPAGRWFANLAAGHMGGITNAARLTLRALDFLHRGLGPKRMLRLASRARKLSWSKLPQWNEWVPRPLVWSPGSETEREGFEKAVYFPSCVSRTMGLSRGSREREPLAGKTVSLLRKAGFSVVYPRHLDRLCCGLVFASKGFESASRRLARNLQSELRAAAGTAGIETSSFDPALQSQREGAGTGRYPVLFDTSPCFLHFKEQFPHDAGFDFYEPVTFIEEFLAAKLTFSQIPEPVLVHAPCSAKKLGLDARLKALAERSAAKVLVSEAGCCGFAGDRGFFYPELPESALRDLKESLPVDCRRGYSSSRTCEIGLANHSGIPFESIIYLVDEATTPAAVPVAAHAELVPGLDRR